MFYHRGFEIVNQVEDCDIICFNGGEDINPALYGQKPRREAHVYFDEDRDKIELEGYNKAKELGKFKFGICRGGQLLNVLNGGKLWQDVDGHGRPHNMLDLQTGETIWTSSVHHQQFILGATGKAVATCRESSVKIMEGLNWYRGESDPNFDDDVEVAWYEDDRALCIQGHPEYAGYQELTRYAFQLLERYY